MKHLPHTLTCGVVEGEKNLGFRSSAQRLVFLSPCFYRLYKKCHHVIITNTTKHKAQPARQTSAFVLRIVAPQVRALKWDLKKNSLDLWGISSLRSFSFVLIQFAQHTVYSSLVCYRDLTLSKCCMMPVAWDTSTPVTISVKGRLGTMLARDFRRKWMMPWSVWWTPKSQYLRQNGLGSLWVHEPGWII